jgi:hypothetical protein
MLRASVVAAARRVLAIFIDVLLRDVQPRQAGRAAS